MVSLSNHGVGSLTMARRRQKPGVAMKKITRRRVTRALPSPPVGEGSRPSVAKGRSDEGCWPGVGASIPLTKFARPLGTLP